MQPHMNGHLLINYRQIALDRFQDASKNGTPPQMQMGYLMASQAAAMIDMMNTLRDLRDRMVLKDE